MLVTRDLETKLVVFLKMQSIFDITYPDYENFLNAYKLNVIPGAGTLLAGKILRTAFIEKLLQVHEDDVLLYCFDRNFISTLTKIQRDILLKSRVRIYTVASPELTDPNRQFSYECTLLQLYMLFNFYITFQNMGVVAENVGTTGSWPYRALLTQFSDEQFTRFGRIDFLPPLCHTTAENYAIHSLFKKLSATTINVDSLLCLSSDAQAERTMYCVEVELPDKNSLSSLKYSEFAASFQTALQTAQQKLEMAENACLRQFPVAKNENGITDTQHNEINMKLSELNLNIWLVEGEFVATDNSALLVNYLRRVLHKVSCLTNNLENISYTNTNTVSVPEKMAPETNINAANDYYVARWFKQAASCDAKDIKSFPEIVALIDRFALGDSPDDCFIKIPVNYNSARSLLILNESLDVEEQFQLSSTHETPALTLQMVNILEKLLDLAIARKKELSTLALLKIEALSNQGIQGLSTEELIQEFYKLQPIYVRKLPRVDDYFKHFTHDLDGRKMYPSTMLIHNIPIQTYGIGNWAKASGIVFIEGKSTYVTGFIRPAMSDRLTSIVLDEQRVGAYLKDAGGKPRSREEMIFKIKINHFIKTRVIPDEKPHDIFNKFIVSCNRLPDKRALVTEKLKPTSIVEVRGKFKDFLTDYFNEEYPANFPEDLRAELTKKLINSFAKKYLANSLVKSLLEQHRGHAKLFANKLRRNGMDLHEVLNKISVYREDLNFGNERADLIRSELIKRLGPVIGVFVNQADIEGTLKIGAALRNLRLGEIFEPKYIEVDEDKGTISFTTEAKLHANLETKIGELEIAQPAIQPPVSTPANEFKRTQILYKISAPSPASQPKQPPIAAPAPVASVHAAPGRVAAPAPTRVAAPPPAAANEYTNIRIKNNCVLIDDKCVKKGKKELQTLFHKKKCVALQFPDCEELLKDPEKLACLIEAMDKSIEDLSLCDPMNLTTDVLKALSDLIIKARIKSVSIDKMPKYLEFIRPGISRLDSKSLLNIYNLLPSNVNHVLRANDILLLDKVDTKQKDGSLEVMTYRITHDPSFKKNLDDNVKKMYALAFSLNYKRTIFDISFTESSSVITPKAYFTNLSAVLKGAEFAYKGQIIVRTAADKVMTKIVESLAKFIAAHGKDKFMENLVLDLTAGFASANSYARIAEALAEASFKPTILMPLAPTGLKKSEHSTVRDLYAPLVNNRMVINRMINDISTHNFMAEYEEIAARSVAAPVVPPAAAGVTPMQITNNPATLYNAPTTGKRRDTEKEEESKHAKKGKRNPKS